MIEIGMVVPCYNETDRFLLDYWKSIVGNTINVRWLFVDDGSTDGTFKVLSQVSSDPRIGVLKLSNNLGKGNAIRQGMNVLITDYVGLHYVGYVDCDGAFSEFDIIRLINFALENSQFDAVISSRVALSGREVFRKSSRHYLGRVIATFLTRDWESAPYDTQSGFKIFRVNQCLDEVIKQPFKTRWFVDVELICKLSLMMKSKLLIWEEPVSSWKDIDGSKIKIRNVFLILKEFIIARNYVKKMVNQENKNGSNRNRT